MDSPESYLWTPSPSPHWPCPGQIKHHRTLESSPYFLFFGIWLDVTPCRKPPMTLNTLGWASSSVPPQIAGPTLPHHRPHAIPHICQSHGLWASPPRPVNLPAALPTSHLKARLQDPGKGSEKLTKLGTPHSSVGVTTDTLLMNGSGLTFILTSEADGAAAKSWAFRAKQLCTFTLSLSLFLVYLG